MFKLFAIILIAAVCMTTSADGASVALKVDANQVQNLNSALLDYYGYQIGYPLLTPNVGALTSLLAAASPPRNYIGQSNPVLFRGPFYDQFIGESSIGIVAL